MFVKIKHLFIALLAVLAIGAFQSKCEAANLLIKPDFAFPNKTLSGADKQLQQALAQHDGVAVINALTCYALASQTVSSDLMPNAIERIDSVVSIESNPCVKSLLCLLQAIIYNDIYHTNAYIFDARQVPIDSVSTDYNQWSGQQFRIKISSLLDLALQPRLQLLHSPLADWKPLINANDNTFIFYPSLYDFIAGKAIDIYTGLSHRYPILPARFLQPAIAARQIPEAAHIDEFSRKAHNLCLSLIDAHANNPAPQVNARILTLRCLAPLTVDNDDSIVNSYLEIYTLMSYSEWATEALIACPATDNPRYIAAVKDALQRYPRYFRANALRYQLDLLQQPSISFNRDCNATPGIPFDAKVQLRNATSGKLMFYRVSSAKTDSHNSKLTETIRKNPTLKFDFSVAPQPKPFSVDTAVTVTLLREGNYLVWVESDDIKTDVTPYGSILTCTDLAPMVVSFADSIYPYAVNSSTGSPLSGVTLLSDSRNTKAPTHLGVTDTDGTLKNALAKTGTIKFRLDNQETSCYTGYYNPYRSTEWSTRANMFTSLPLYHHGDSVQWAVVAYQELNQQHRLLQDARLVIEFHDANYNTFDSVTVTTDHTGRACGKIKLPDEGLSGNFSILAFEADKSFLCGSTNFTVNDYKLPTFFAEITDLRRTACSDSTVIVSCKAETYSGFPMPLAKVNVTLTAGSRYWWESSPNTVFWSLDTIIGTDGSVTLPLSDPLLSLSPTGSKTYNITFNVTSPSGETRSCSRFFTIGKPFTIYVPGIDNINADEPLGNIASVVDAMGSNVTIPLIYNIKSHRGDTINVTSGNKLPNSLQSGIYSVTVTPVDSTLADPATIGNVKIYRAKGNSPTPDPLFLPVTKFNCDTPCQTITYGVGVDNVNLLLITAVDNRVVSRQWLKPSKGMQHVDIDIPAECNEVKVSFSTIYNNRHYQQSATITNNRTRRNLGISIETFRDKVVPDTHEQITLKVNINGKGISAPLMLLMQSEALLQLQGQPFNLYVPGPYSPQFSANFHNDYSSGSIHDTTRHLEWPIITLPALNLYGRSFSSRAVKLRGTMFRAMSGKAMVVDDAEEEVAVVEYASSAMVTNDTAEIAEDSGSETPSTQPKNSDNFNYRPASVPLAFFEPMLNTLPDGSINFTYSVPPAITTWQFRALAYTPELLSATTQCLIVASKPVMVQPTLPRFLRYGDTALLRASLMNATDSTQHVTSTVTILNPLNMSVLASRTFADTIAANSTTTVTLPFSAPTEGQALIYRVKCTSGQFSDGEQQIIPLLPASQPVISSAPFFIPADSTHFTLKLSPITSLSSKSTLYMYDNPIWEIISALPSLSADNAVTANNAIDNIYMASIARGILSKNKSLKSGLKCWLESDRSDSTLTSMLARNDDLKQITLQATPWAQDAMSDNERLSALALLLDDRNLRSVIERNIATLQSLALPDGSFSWCKGMQATSTWATYYVLTRASYLEQLHFDPDDNDYHRLVGNAVSYIDSDMNRQLMDSKTGIVVNGRYTLIRSLLHNVRHNATSQHVINNTIQNILKTWQNCSTPRKATYAIILYHNNYKSMARRLVESIKATSMHTPSKGTWWDNTDIETTASTLSAIETVTPTDTSFISSVAQWLILNKANRSWGNNSATSTVVDALIGAIDTEKAVIGTTSVTLNAISVKNDTPQLPGMTVVDISGSLSSPVSLTVTKTTGLPAFGSVISHSIMNLDNIPAKANQSVSITKRTNVERGTSLINTDTLNIADRVKIQLIIKVTDPLDYVTIIDRRAACLEPTDQLSCYTAADGLWFYREITDSETRLYIDHLPRGTYLIDTDMTITATGSFASGVASLQSQLNPGIVANSSSKRLEVK